MSSPLIKILIKFQVNGMNACGIQAILPQGNIFQRMEQQILPTRPEQSPVIQSSEPTEVQENTTHSTPTTTTQPNPPTINNSTPQRQEQTNTTSAAQSPNHTTDSIPPQVNSSHPMKPICLKEGCTNPSVESTEWDNEYCSSECVVTHCRCVLQLCLNCHLRLILFFHLFNYFFVFHRNVFGAWVSERQAANSEGSIK